MSSDGWWPLNQGMNQFGVTPSHANPHSTMAEKRLFTQKSSDIWDLRDAVLEVQANEQRLESNLRLNQTGISNFQDFPHRFNSTEISTWLSQSTNNGFIRVFPPDSNKLSKSRLVACSTDTTSSHICNQLNITSLHMQLNGDRIRRLNSHDLPLMLQNDFLVSLGFSNILRMQQEALHEDLQHLIMFHAGKPTYGTMQASLVPLQGELMVKKGGVFQHWGNKYAVIFNTRMHFYKNESKLDRPQIMQLAGGHVERCKNNHLSIKVMTKDADKQFSLLFNAEEQCLEWFVALKKATDKLPTVADLSCCHLEHIPGNLFINTNLTILNLQHNVLKTRGGSNGESGSSRVVNAKDNVNNNSSVSSSSNNNHRNKNDVDGSTNDSDSFSKRANNVVESAQSNTNNNGDGWDEDEEMKIWYIEDISRFQHLRSLNLSDNYLTHIPQPITTIKSLVELNFSSNQITVVPSQIKELSQLQVLQLHNNLLKDLPVEMVTLTRLHNLTLSFNNLQCITQHIAQLTDIRFTDLDNLILAGNAISIIDEQVIPSLKYVRKLDLRLNRLTLPPSLTSKFTSLQRLTHLDLRDNQITELDLRALKTLEMLVCERNGMTSLTLNGACLKVLLASCNCLDVVKVTPKPENLVHLDVSDNCLETLPDWLSSCMHLKKFLLQENFLRELPQKLLCNLKKLTHLNLAHNHLTYLTSEVGCLLLEELHIQHNYISQLPAMLLKNLCRLTVLNGSGNLLHNIVAAHQHTDLNIIQELQLASNCLGNKAFSIICSFSRLKVLNLARNEIDHIDEEDIIKLQLLQDLNLSNNQLQSLPTSVGQLPHLTCLKLQSNYLTSLPPLQSSTSLRILDVSDNQLIDMTVTQYLSSKLNLLDMSMNQQLKVDPASFKAIKNRKSICLVDTSGHNRRLPGLHKKRYANTLSHPYMTDSICEETSVPWKVGFAESMGARNKLCIQTVRQMHEDECVVGLLDGGFNNELPKLLNKKMNQIIKEEKSNPVTKDKFLKYVLLNCHRSLKAAGQKLGVAATLCHIAKIHNINNNNNKNNNNDENEVRSSSTSSNVSNRSKSSSRNNRNANNVDDNDTSNNKNNNDNNKKEYLLSVANVGDVEAVLCRKGEAVLLTRKFTVSNDNEELMRLLSNGAIITEDGRVDGSSRSTRMLGCGNMHPRVIPAPFCAHLRLRCQDEFLIIANSAFWSYVPYEEAIEHAYNVGNPVLAAKKLLSIAESYGSKENIAVLVLRINTEPGPSLGRLKPTNKEMSVDDVEAAIQHDLKLAARRNNDKKNNIYNNNTNNNSYTNNNNNNNKLILDAPMRHFEPLAITKNRALYQRLSLPAPKFEPSNNNNNNNKNESNNNNVDILYESTSTLYANDSSQYLDNDNNNNNIDSMNYDYNSMNKREINRDSAFNNTGNHINTSCNNENNNINNNMREQHKLSFKPFQQQQQINTSLQPLQSMQQNLPSQQIPQQSLFHQKIQPPPTQPKPQLPPSQQKLQPPQQHTTPHNTKPVIIHPKPRLEVPPNVFKPEQMSTLQKYQQPKQNYQLQQQQLPTKTTRFTKKTPAIDSIKISPSPPLLSLSPTPSSTQYLLHSEYTFENTIIPSNNSTTTTNNNKINNINNRHYFNVTSHSPTTPNLEQKDMELINIFSNPPIPNRDAIRRSSVINTVAMFDSISNNNNNINTNNSYSNNMNNSNNKMNSNNSNKGIIKPQPRKNHQPDERRPSVIRSSYNIDPLPKLSNVIRGNIFMEGIDNNNNNYSAYNTNYNNKNIIRPNSRQSNI